MASDTFVNYITKVRRYLHEPDPLRSFWTDPMLEHLFNSAYRMRCSELVMAFEGYFVNTTTMDLVANQANYLWPEGFERLQKLEILRSDGRSQPLKRFERHEETNTPGVDGSDSYFPNFRPLGEGFVLEPLPLTGTTAKGVIESFTTDPIGDATYTTSTDGRLYQATSAQLTRDTEASVAAAKDGATEAFVDILRDSQVIDLSFATINTNTSSIQTYVSDLADLTGVISITVGDAGLTNSDTWDLTQTFSGWQTHSFRLDIPDSSTGTGADLSAITDWTIRFTFSGTAASTVVMAVDDWSYEFSGTGVDRLKLEWIGTPVLLSADTQRLHPDFPVSYDELLVIDTAVMAMDTESNLENGAPNSIIRLRNDWEVRWERYIDSKIIARQEIVPFVGWYEDA